MQLPDRFATSVGSNTSDKKHTRRKSAVITPVSLGIQSLRKYSRSLRSARGSLDTSATSSPTRRPSSAPIRRMSVDSLLPDAKLLSERQEVFDFSNIEYTKDEEDIFIHYYSTDQAIEAMTSPDARKIFGQFENSPWSGKLRDIDVYKSNLFFM